MITKAKKEPRRVPGIGGYPLPRDLRKKKGYPYTGIKINSVRPNPKAHLFFYRSQIQADLQSLLSEKL